MSESQPDPDKVDSLLETVRLRYGDHLNKDQLAEVRAGVEAVAAASEELRSVKLDNGDEPFFIFKPYRGDD
ncbi:MAG: hypothetical protein O2821_07645 [Chloroflexi bacterium]|nr:hypothetical protein [Chloroflexota bacterium]MDA1226803.1 hypothetical protein [Chloroflexota bacterium]